MIYVISSRLSFFNPSFTDEESSFRSQLYFYSSYVYNHGKFLVLDLAPALKHITSQFVTILLFTDIVLSVAPLEKKRN